jgi:hypothetical protein
MATYVCNPWWLGRRGPAAGAVATAEDERQDKEKMKHTIDNLMMFSIAVTDMPKAKAFYSDKLGFNEVKNDLFGPGSGVKWFRVEDPDGNQVLLVWYSLAITSRDQPGGYLEWSARCLRADEAR